VYNISYTKVNKWWFYYYSDS